MAVRFEAFAVLLYLMCCISFLTAQPDRIFTSSYNSGLQNSDHFSSQNDVFILNPSILAFDLSPFITTQIQSRYSGFDIFSYALHTITPLPGNFGAGASLLQFGKEDFKYFRTIISAGKRLSPELGLGFSQQISRLRIAGDNRSWYGSSLISLTYKGGFWGAALHMNGLFQFGVAQNDTRNWSATIAGFYRLTMMTVFFLTIDSENKKIQTSMGFRQKLIQNIELFAGLQIYPVRYGVGITVPLLSFLQGIVSTELHPVLGWSPSIGIQWNIERKETNANELP